MFVGLLELACPRRPVILHLRGQDRYSSEHRWISCPVSTRYSGAAVRRIPLNRLLVETDSPYLRVQRQWHNTPAYVGEVARKVAQIRQTTLDEILQASLENGRLPL
ncbi:uncharacterized metal-dependent hydrolase BUsg_343-like [Dreissena polymorpha]|uniref:uncharacterized metal-dependent hydrolase BUsg_343-like n=1 Tax=Dreissena polymorpha TaxID=45954 RepID=UPI002263F20A|nr:uncharacterized metal-dependent hydrolase BUsg_343-like [Dreissena polymorpha]